MYQYLFYRFCNVNLFHIANLPFDRWFWKTSTRRMETGGPCPRQKAPRQPETRGRVSSTRKTWLSSGRASQSYQTPGQLTSRGRFWKVWSPTFIQLSPVDNEILGLNQKSGDRATVLQYENPTTIYDPKGISNDPKNPDTDQLKGLNKRSLKIIWSLKVILRYLNLKNGWVVFFKSSLSQKVPSFRIN